MANARLGLLLAIVSLVLMGLTPTLYWNVPSVYISYAAFILASIATVISAIINIKVLLQEHTKADALKAIFGIIITTVSLLTLIGIVLKFMSYSM